MGVFSFLAASSILLAQAPTREVENNPPRFILEWGQKRAQNGEFNFPIGIAITPADEILVTDNKNKRVQKFSVDGKFLTALTVPKSPAGIALDKDGNIYVTHLMLDKVSVHSSAGKLLREWGQRGNGEGELKQPGGIAVAKDGSVFIADMENNRVQKFTAEGKYLAQWGEYGMKPGQFGGNIAPVTRMGGPNFLALDSQGNLYTTEGSVGRVQKFTADGKYLLSWGDNENKPGSFGGVLARYGPTQGPAGICFDKQDRVWVSALRGRVQQFTTEGRFLRGFGAEGTKPGQFFAPHSMALDSKGCLYVVDASNHRVQKFDVSP